MSGSRWSGPGARLDWPAFIANAAQCFQHRQTCYINTERAPVQQLKVTWDKVGLRGDETGRIFDEP